MSTSAKFCQWLVVSISIVLATAISPSAQASTCTPAPSGLVSWWRAEGNGLDSVGGNTAYAALLPGGVSFGPGEVGQGFRLNSTNAYLIVPASPTLNVGAGSGFTAEAWINISNADGYHPILEWNNSARLSGAMLWVLPAGTLFANIVDTNQNSHSFASSNGAVSANAFQHVALTYDRSTGIGTLYLNGAVVAHATLGSFVAETTFNLWFGHRPADVPGDATYGSYLGGILDEVSLYNRALTSNEIAGIYNAGASGKCGDSSSNTAPVITHQPTNSTVAAGANAVFTVTATGAAPLHYQWYGPASALIPSATSSTLILSNVQPSASGAYFVLVTNQVGFAISSNAVLTVTGGGSNSNSCTPPPSGLVGWWKGENNTLDSAGTNNGFVALGPVSYAPGEVGRAFYYDTAGGFVAVPPSPSLNVGLGSGFTLEAWIKPDDLENQMPIFEWQFDTNTDANGIHFWISSQNGPGCLFANIVDSNFTSHWIYSAPGLITADYQHVALTYTKSNGVASIYRNGVLVASQNIGSFTPNTTGNLLLGERTYLDNEPQNHYLGGLDEMSVYNRALSQSEIAAIYNAGSNGKCGGANSVAPAITRQPTNQTVSVGGTASFSVTATGSDPLHFQWYGPNTAAIPGATNSTLTMSNVQPASAGAYYVFVMNASGFAQSSNALLTVNASGLTGTGLVVPNYSATNQIAYSSSGSLNQPVREQMVYGASEFPSYPIKITEIRWRPDAYAGGPISITMSNLQIKLSTTLASPDQLSVIFTQNTGTDETVVFNGAASVSTAFTTLSNGTTAFDIRLPLQTPFVYDSTKGNLLVDLRNLYGCTPSTINFVNAAGGKDATSRVFTTDPNATNAAVADTAGDVLEIIYTAATNTAPLITQQPTNQTVAAGGTASFSVLATGSPAVPLHFQWYGPNSTLIPGATHSLLTLSNVQPSAAGAYFVRVTNIFGSAQSSNAVLTVTGAGPVSTELVVPNYSISNQVYNPAGTLNQPLRMQMVYGASQFPSHPILITEIRWRPDVNTQGPLSVIVSNLLIKLSTTKATPDNLSTIFTQNIGSNETVAFSGAASISTAFTTLSNGTKAFDISLPLQTPFAFDPTKGNLLVDLRNLYGCIPARSVEFNIVNSTGEDDAVSRVFSVDPNATNAETADTGADVLEIIYTAATNSGTAPLITHEPTNQTVAAGANAAFSVTATGTSPLHYQWYAPGEALIPGATAATLVLSNVQPANAGGYFVLVTNQFGFAISSNATLTVTGGIGGGTNSCTPPSSGLAAWWPAEGNGTDIVGGATATLHGGASFGPGEVGQSFLLNGTNDYLTATNPSLNIAADGSLTVEAWIKISDVTSYHPIVEWNDGAGNAGVHLWILPYSGETSDVLFANLVDTGGVSHSFHSPGGSVSANVFQHVALTYDQGSGVATLYVNGNSVAQANFGPFMPQTAFPFFMGHRPNDVPGYSTYGAYLSGPLDELSLYSRALSQSEIAAIYNAGANGKCSPTNSGTGTAPVITTQPTNRTVTAGANVTFTAAATGSPTLHYQWYGPGSALIPGATTSTLTLSNVQPTQAGAYYMFVTNSFGFAQSSNAVLTVIGQPPVITRQPTNQIVPVGGTATFSVIATGAPTVVLHFQWYGPNSTLIPGAVSSVLTLSNVQPTQAGTYFALVTNNFGSAISSNALLTVTSDGGGTNSCSPAPSGLVSWWKAEGNAHDSADGNNGTLVNGVGFAAGEVGQAFLFTHTNQDVLIPASSNLDVGLGDGLTVEAWIKPSDITNYDPIFEWNAGDGVTYWGPHLYVLPTGDGSGQLYANVQGVGDNWHQMWSSPGLVTPNTFQHVALTYDKASGVARLYLNGAIVVETAFGTFTPKTSANLNIGNRPTDPAGSQFTFTGLIDEPAVYNRALRSNEIAAIYNAGANGKCDLTNSNTGTAPVITQQPTNQTVNVGGNATFRVTATGSPTLHYLWFGPNSTLIPGATGSTLTISNAQPTNAGTYYAYVTNSFGIARSSNALLTVTVVGPPVITRQPTNQTVAVGGTATFSVLATGSPAVVNYLQWYGPNGTLIPGAIHSVLTLSNVQPAAAGAYFAVVTNVFGSATSSNAVLTVTNPVVVPSCVTAPTNIAAWWPAEGTGMDIIGGATATLHGGATYAPGEVGQAFSFNGTNAYISVPASASVDVGLGSGLTIECWIQPDHLGPIGAEGRPIVEYDTASSIGVHFWVENGFRLYANIKDTAGADHTIISEPGTVSTNVPSHVAVTYDRTNGTCFLYINSVMVASNNLGSFTPQTSYPLYLGLRAAQGFPGSGSLYNGMLDELSLYSRALTGAEIGAIYNAGSNGKCPPSPVVPHVVFNPQPVVTMSVAGSSPVLSWPASATGYILQSADNLTPPILWTNVPGPFETNGSTIDITLPEGGQRGYFRLYHP